MQSERTTQGTGHGLTLYGCQQTWNRGVVEASKPQNPDSGKFVLRIPKSLHRRLAIEAQKEGVSLNQYALYKLSR